MYVCRRFASFEALLSRSSYQPTISPQLIKEGMSLEEADFVRALQDLKPLAVKLAFEHYKLTSKVVSSQVYEAILNRVAKQFDLEASTEIFESMPEKTLVAFNIMIRMCSKMKRIQKAEHFFMELKAAGLTPSYVTYIGLMQGYAMVPDPGAAEEVLLTMRSEGISPTHHTFTVLLTSYSRKGDFQKCEKVIQRMSDAGFTPDNYDYNSWMASFIRTCDFGSAYGVYKGIREPTTVNLNTLLACARDSKENRDIVLGLFEDLGLSHDRETFKILDSIET